MKITLDNRRGVVAGVWLIIVMFVVFIVIIGWIFYTCVKTLQRIIPPPPPDDKGWVPKIGDTYYGGVVTGYAPPPMPHYTPEYLESEAPPGFTIHRVYIFAADLPRPAVWTNCIWQGDLADVTNAFGSNGLPVESWPAGQMPASRYYNIVVSNSNQ